MNHRAGAQEQQALEERVRDQVEQPGDPAADAEGEHHVAELADGGVGQHALDVDGRDGDRRREEQRDAADDRRSPAALRARTPDRSGRRGTRRRRPSSPSARAPRRASGLPSRRATTCAAGTGRSCRRSRRRCRRRRRPAASSPSRCSRAGAQLRLRSPASIAAGVAAVAATIFGDFVAGLERDHAVGRRELVIVLLGVRSWLKMPGCSTLPSVVRHVAEVRTCRGCDHSAIRPMSMPKSPTRLTMNALFAAVLALLPLDVKADQEIRADAHQLPEHEHHRQVAGDARSPAC